MADKLTVAELQRELESRGLPSGGRKADLMERLLCATLGRTSLDQTVAAQEEDTENDDDYEDACDITSNSTDATSSHDKRRSSNLRPAEVADVLPVFNPNDPSSLDSANWIRVVKEIMDEYGIDEKTVMMVINKKLEGPSKLWHSGLLKKTGYVKFDMFVKELVNTFPNNVCEVDIHTKLRNKVRAKNQSFQDFYFEVVDLASGKISDEAIIKYVSLNINDAVLGGSLKTNQVKTTSKLLERLQHYELLDDPCKPKQETVGSMDSMSVGPRDSKPATSNMRGNQNDNLKERRNQCFNCFGYGHIGVNCPSPLRKEKCNKCGKIGHSEERCFVKTPPGAINKGKVFCVCDNSEQQKESEAGQLQVDKGGMVNALCVAEGHLQQVPMMIDSGSSVSIEP